MLKHSISIVGLLAAVVWLAYPLTGSSESPPSVNYDVVAQTSDQGRSFVVRDTTIEPGGSIGWHWHRGTVIAVVKEGTLLHYGADCAVDGVYRPGESFIEPGGAEHVHDGRNAGTTPVVLEVLYILPAGEPLADAHDPPECATQR